MATLYHTINRRSHVDQPQLGRVRHRFRGPRESPKLNLEMAQLLFDIRRVSERYDAIREDFVTHVDMVIDGGSLTGVTVSAVVVIVEGIDDLAIRIDRLVNRLKILEA